MWATTTLAMTFLVIKAFLAGPGKALVAMFLANAVCVQVRWSLSRFRALACEAASSNLSVQRREA